MTYCEKRLEPSWGMAQFRATPQPTIPLVRRLSGPITGPRGEGGWTVDAMTASMSSRRRSTKGNRETRPRTAVDRSTISDSGGQGRGVVWVATLQTGGGARRWLTRWRTLWTTKTLLSQRAPLAAVVGALPGKPYWRRVGTNSPRRLRQSEARLRLACRRLARCAAPGGGGSEWSDPIFGADAPPGG